MGKGTIGTRLSLIQANYKKVGKPQKMLLGLSKPFLLRLNLSF